REVLESAIASSLVPQYRDLARLCRTPADLVPGGIRDLSFATSIGGRGGAVNRFHVYRNGGALSFHYPASRRDTILVRTQAHCAQLMPAHIPDLVPRGAYPAASRTLAFGHWRPRRNFGSFWSH